MCLLQIPLPPLQDVVIAAFRPSHATSQGQTIFGGQGKEELRSCHYCRVVKAHCLAFQVPGVGLLSHRQGKPQSTSSLCYALLWSAWAMLLHLGVRSGLDDYGRPCLGKTLLYAGQPNDSTHRKPGSAIVCMHGASRGVRPTVFGLKPDSAQSCFSPIISTVKLCIQPNNSTSLNGMQRLLLCFHEQKSHFVS